MKQFFTGAILGVILALAIPRLIHRPPTEIQARVDTVLGDSAVSDSLRARLRLAMSAQSALASRVRRAEWASNATANQLREAENALDSLPLAVRGLHQAQAERDSLGAALVASRALQTEYAAVAEARIRLLTGTLVATRPHLGTPKVWSLGVLFKGVSPNGAYVSRDLLGRVNVLAQMTGNPMELRMGLGFNF